MLSHVMIGTNDIDKAKSFYEKILSVVGFEGSGMDNTSASGHRRVFFMHDGDILALTQPINGEPATCANGMTIGLKCTSPEQVQELYDVAVANGATGIEDPPGLRNASMGKIYLSYFRDLDGHKICGLHRAAD